VKQALIENLLNEDESSSLDFKRDQYPFEGATDAEKGELIKDILAFANAWRRSDAYILIGVDEVRGGRSTPVGVQKHLDDAKLQQCVNSKTNRPVEFRYEVATVDQLEIGIIHIPLQERPIYVAKDFGRLSRNTVYIRRSSSTDIATPDEISKMRLPLEGTSGKPKLSLVGRVSPTGGRVQVVVAIKNEAGAGPARAPRLLFRLSPAFQASQWGLDGNGNNGLPRMPQSPGSQGFVFAGGTSTVIHPGTEHEVTCVDYVGAPEKRPPRLEIQYELTAEETQPSKDTLEVQL